MALSRTRSRRRASITSLIDVIFLLLLFFMLASSFSRFSEVALASADTSGAASIGEETVYRVVVSPASVAFEGQAYGDAAIRVRLGAVLSERPGLVLMTVSPDTSTQRLVDVLTRLNGVPGGEIRLEPTS